MTPPSLLWTIGAFVVALGILIVVHEFGHFALARLCGVKVLRFSVGFGKPLLTRRWGKDQTEWVLALFPLGGYVKMLDEHEGDVPEEDLHRAFNRQSLGRRSLIVLAGPLANLLLAVFIYWGVYLQGVEELRPVLGAPVVGSPAARAGFEAGEKVRAVSGIRVSTWQEFRWELLRRAVDKELLELEVENPKGEIAFRRLDLRDFDASNLESDLPGELGLLLYRPQLKPVIGKVLPGSPAETAGFAQEDEVIAIDDRPIETWGELAKTIRRSPGQTLRFDILRKGAPVHLSVMPSPAEEGGQTVGRIGIAAREDPSLRAAMFVTVQLGMDDALGRAVQQTWETSVFTLRMIGRMVIGDLSWKNVSGPVTIADYAGQSANMGGSHYLRFIALISISLGVLNLLPIPVLDGGHLMYHLAELIKGGPLSEQAIEVGQRIGLSVLVLLMASALYNDFNRLVSG